MVSWTYHVSSPSDLFTQGVEAALRCDALLDFDAPVVAAVDGVLLLLPLLLLVAVAVVEEAAGAALPPTSKAAVSTTRPSPGGSAHALSPVTECTYHTSPNPSDLRCHRPGLTARGLWVTMGGSRGVGGGEATAEGAAGGGAVSLAKAAARFPLNSARSLRCTRMEAAQPVSRRRPHVQQQQQWVAMEERVRE